ncbi:MAG: chemotaxis protein CheW [Proteobacteria bacterium]|nr:chemotaxis protein CheW [Pseudomonadota bacterium]
MAELLKPLGLPTFLSGFINIEGQAIPVIALSILIGSAEQSIEMYTPLIILENEEISMALIS